MTVCARRKSREIVFGRGFDSPHLHQKCARRTQEPVIYVAGNLFVLVCPLAYAMDK